MDLVQRSIAYGKAVVEQIIQDFLWIHYRHSGTLWPTEREVTISNIEKEVRGEFSEREDYQHLPPWQWTSVSDLREMGVGISHKLPSGGGSGGP